MAPIFNIDKLVSRVGAFSLTVSMVSYSFSAGKISVFGPRLQSFFSFPDLAFNFSALTRAIVTGLAIVLVVQVAMFLGSNIAARHPATVARVQRLVAALFSIRATVLISLPISLAIYIVWQPFITNEYDVEYRILFHILLPMLGLALWFSLGRLLMGTADGYVVLTTLVPAILVFSFFVGRFESIAQVSCFEQDGVADRRYAVQSYGKDGVWRDDGEAYKIIVASPDRALFFRRLPDRSAFIRLWDFSQDRALMRYMIKDGPLNSLPCRAKS